MQSLVVKVLWRGAQHIQHPVLAWCCLGSTGWAGQRTWVTLMNCRPALVRIKEVMACTHHPRRCDIPDLCSQDLHHVACTLALARSTPLSGFLSSLLAASAITDSRYSFPKGMLDH